jgi:SAM-dependent methyltransferase
VFIFPAPDAADLVRLYDTSEASIANSDSWIMARDYAASPQMVRQVYRRLRIDWLTDRGYLAGPHTSVLDIGCSTGIFLRVLADQGFHRLHGVDISPLHRDYVEQHHGIQCHSSLGEVPDACFDLVTCYAILEHTAEPLEFLRQISMKLKPGGRVVVLVPNYESWYRMVARERWVWLIPPVHLQYFGPNSLAKTIELAELEMVECRSGYGGTYTYLLAHHLMQVLGRPMPSTGRTGRPKTMLLVNGLEALLRVSLAPVSWLATRRDRHNELTCVAMKPRLLHVP